MGRSGPLRVLVTGASRGIGEAIVARLSADGHQLALNARTVADLEQLAARLQGPTLVLPADCTDPSSGDDLVRAVIDEWGGIDVLVLNAGEGVAAAITSTDDALWQRQLDLNLTSPFRFIRAAVPPMRPPVSDASLLSQASHRSVASRTSVPTWPPSTACSASCVPRRPNSPVPASP